MAWLIEKAAEIGESGSSEDIALLEKRIDETLANKKLIVSPLAPENVLLSKYLVTDVKAGGTVALTAQISPFCANQGITWSSSNANVAFVDAKGNVTVKAKGTAVITARSTAKASVVATCKIVVK